MKTTKKTEADDLLKPSDFETPVTKSNKTSKNDTFTDKELKDLFGEPVQKKPKIKRPSLIRAYFNYLSEVILR